MRIAVIVLVILGTLATAGLGIKWLSDYNDNKALVETAKDIMGSISTDSSTDSGFDSAVNDYESYKTKGIVLIVCGLVALVAVFLLKKLGKIGSGIILVAAVVPAFFDPGTLIFTSLLLIGGILSLFIKEKTPAAA